MPSQAIAEAGKESHSSSPENDKRNRKYLIRRAALGDNPTQNEMGAVVAYGIKQNRLNCSAPDTAIDISDDSSHNSSGVKSALSSVH